MAEDYDQDKDKEVAIETPMGKLRARGYHLGNVLQIVAAVLLALMAMMMYEMRAETKATAAALTSATKDSVKELAMATKIEHEALAKAMDRAAEEQSITNFIFTLTPAEREKLHLQMPEALRRRLRER